LASYPHRRRIIITNTTLYLAFAAASARAILSLRDSSDFGFAVGMLTLYLLLIPLGHWLMSRKLAYLHIINALQASIALILLLFVDNFDYFSLLFIPPCAQSIMNFPRKTALIWIGAICLFMEVALFIHFPFEESIGYAIIYPAGIFLVTGFCYLALQAEEAQTRSETLLVDLQKANHKLQAYAAQVQELAAAEERNRLARELHDSVTQIVFGLTLSAQAARILMDRDPKRAAAELDHMQVLAQNALAEMRALIQQLHPRSIAEEGLAPALRRLAADRQASDGLAVDFKVRGEKRLTPKVEEELFKVAQEALNNIVKHAHADIAVITLNLEDPNRITMGIEDNGVGFDPGSISSMPGHLGLTSMSERIQAFGGKFTIDSAPGKGVRLLVELTLAQEVEHV